MCNSLHGNQKRPGPLSLSRSLADFRARWQWSGVATPTRSCCVAIHDLGAIVVRTGGAVEVEVRPKAQRQHLVVGCRSARDRRNGETERERCREDRTRAHDYRSYDCGPWETPRTAARGTTPTTASAWTNHKPHTTNPPRSAWAHSLTTQATFLGRISTGVRRIPDAARGAACRTRQARNRCREPVLHEWGNDSLYHRRAGPPARCRPACGGAEPPCVVGFRTR